MWVTISNERSATTWTDNLKLSDCTKGQTGNDTVKPQRIIDFYDAGDVNLPEQPHY